jgi:hypothetical protein
VALLAVPLALMAREYASAVQECTMACCRGRHVSAAKMKCGHAAKGGAGAALCTMGCESQTTDYGLNCPLPPFQLSASAKLPAMRPGRLSFSVAEILDFAGYFPPPFNPPRT